MFKIKDNPSKKTDGKRSITINSVSIEDGILVDENGSIADGIAENLPDGVEEFTIKIQVLLPEEE